MLIVVIVISILPGVLHELGLSFVRGLYCFYFGID